MLTDTRKSTYAKVSPLSFDSISWSEGFWKDVTTACFEKTVPHLHKMFADKDISHVVENFRICAGETEGSFGGTDFGDGDFYKWMEAAMYTAVKTNNQELLLQLEEYISLIGRAQLADGYLSTKQILGEREQNGVKRFGNINDFEVYNFGHLFTTAALYTRLTGKKTLLAVAEKVAHYLKEMYEENARTGKVQTAVCPSHYMGLIELYRVTEDEQYLELASLAISLRDSITDGTDDNQDRILLKEQRKILGHAVRANYLYSGVADLYLEKGDEEYEEVLDSVWRNLVDQKMYITGGCGALYNGASPYGKFFVHDKVHQAYGYEYQLPNVTAYNETCASVGLVLWAYRMFQINPKAEYFDTIERAMLNVNLAAIDLEGTKFFYENMLRRTKNLPYELIWPLERSSYILSYCCPPNLARLLAQSSEYAYLVSEDTLWCGLYGESQADIALPNGATFHLQQETKYPYDGRIEMTLTDIQAKENCFINVRIPSWAKDGWVQKGDFKQVLTEKDSGTYLTIALSEADREAGNASLIVQFDMPVRYTMSHSYVEENINQVAVERGPLVYCVEGMDTEIETLDDILLEVKGTFKPVASAVGNRDVVALVGEAYRIQRNGYDREALYQNFKYDGLEKTSLRFIPYFAWDNRGFDEMRIWFPIAYC
jgi:Uncharacterized protein conserved in bacteria